MDVEEALAFLDYLDEAGVPVNVDEDCEAESEAWSEFEGLSSSEEELLDEDLLGGGGPGDEPSSGVEDGDRLGDVVLQSCSWWTRTWERSRTRS